MARMETFRSIDRYMREARRARSTTYGGPGYLFCERHRERFRDNVACPVCVPNQTPPPRRRVRR